MMTAMILFASVARAAEVIPLYPGFLTRDRCHGRLKLSAVGDESLVERQALPATSECGVILRPLGKTGRTDLLLETTTGSVHRILEIQSSGPTSAGALEWEEK
jgi:hypothetical protein